MGLTGVSISSIQRQSLMRTISILLPPAAFFLIIALLIIGQTDYLIIGFYILLPMFMAPALYHVAIHSTRERSKIAPVRLLLTVSIICLVVAVILGNSKPRPRAFFISLAIVNTLALVLALDQQKIVSLVLASSSSVIFHLSTTLTSARFFGSGDGHTNWISAKNTVATHTTDFAHAGYHDYPNFYSLVGTVASLTGFDGRTALYITGAATMLMGIWFTAFFASKLPFFPNQYVTVPGVLLTFMYEFLFSGVYSLPRSAFGQLSILVFALSAVFIYSRGKMGIKYKVPLFILCFSLIFYHRVGQVFLLFTLSILLVSALTELDVTDPFGPGLRIPAIAFGVGFVFWMAETGVAGALALRFLYLGRELAGVDSIGGGESLFLSEPVGVLFTYLASSLVIAFLAITIFSVATSQSNKRGILSFIIACMIFAVLYFPSPIQLALRVFSFRRIVKFVLPFVAIATSIGLIHSWNTHIQWRPNVPIMPLILAFLLITSGTIALSSDLHARDNPISQTGSNSNYLSSTEDSLLDFTLAYGGNVSGDRVAYDYLVEEKHGAVGWGGPMEATPTIVNSSTELCDVQFMLRGSEIDRRGYTIIYYTDHIELSDWTTTPATQEYIYQRTDLRGYNSRNLIYSAGDDQLLSKCTL